MMTMMTNTRLLAEEMLSLRWPSGGHCRGGFYSFSHPPHPPAPLPSTHPPIHSSSHPSPPVPLRRSLQLFPVAMKPRWVSIVNPSPKQLAEKCRFRRVSKPTPQRLLSISISSHLLIFHIYKYNHSSATRALISI